MNTDLFSMRYASCVAALFFGIASIACAQDGKSPAGAKGKPIRVEVVKPAQRPMVRELKIPATLLADERVDLYAKTSGYVSRIELNIGSDVKRGDVLVELAVPEMADELRQAQAVLRAKQAGVRALQAKVAQAQRMIEIADAQVQRYKAQSELDATNLNRVAQLRKGNALPEQALDEARSAAAVSDAQTRIAEARVAGARAEKLAVDADAEVAQAEVMVAQANVARIKTLMEYASIRAPFDGVITVRNVDHGAFIRSAAEGTATPLLRLAKVDRIRVMIEVPETDAPFVRKGTKVDVVIGALDDRKFPAAVSRTAAAVKPDTRTMRAEIDIDNADGRLIPGMYAQAVVMLQRKDDAMMIPSKAVRLDGKKTVVMIAAAGVAKSTPIKIGYDDGIWAEVISGLNGNESVITSSSGTVSAGTNVTIVSSDS